MFINELLVPIVAYFPSAKSSSLLFPLSSFSFSFLSFASAAAEFRFKEALLGLFFTTEQLFPLHGDHLVDSLLDDLHVPEDREMVLTARV